MDTMKCQFGRKKKEEKKSETTLLGMTSKMSTKFARRKEGRKERDRSHTTQRNPWLRTILAFRSRLHSGGRGGGKQNSPRQDSSSGKLEAALQYPEIKRVRPINPETSIYCSSVDPTTDASFPQLLNERGLKGRGNVKASLIL